MSLAQVFARKQLTILGMNSGTSADGLDLAVLQISNSGKKQIKFIDGKCVPYPSDLRQAVLNMCDSKHVVLDEVIFLDSLLGKFYGKAAARFIKEMAKRGIVVDAVASHGQTVRHLPHKTRYLKQKVHGTLQIGSLETIAAITGKPVVGDFRQADIALGNEGAPITVAAMARLFGYPIQSRLIVNIGGMANYFYFPAGAAESKIQAADTGPGNVISDLLSRYLYNQECDRNGSHAARGRVSEKLYRSVFKDSAKRTIKSTGREQFGEQMARALVKRGLSLKLSKDDIIATGLEETVRSLSERLGSITSRDRTLDKLYLTGGGVHNSFLVERLRQVLAPCCIMSVSELGFDPDLVEASAYAVMGSACLRSEPIATLFGPREANKLRPVCGRIVQPPARTMTSR